MPDTQAPILQLPAAQRPVEPPARAAALTAARHLKMARSAHAYVRGNTAKFYEWLSGVTAACPDGPPIWICGDCHIGNLGPVADGAGRVDIQIRDLDQTVIGNPAHDLIRLGLSLASAARGSDLPGAITVHMLEQMVEGYEGAFDTDAPKPRADDHPDTVRLILKEALGRSWKHLARDRIGDAKPTIPLGRRFWPLDAAERAAVDALFAGDDVRRLAASLHGADPAAEVRVMDAAYWMKGCSSLGLLRLAVVARVGGKGGELCLMDIKEAAAAVAPRAPKAAMPRDNAERVVEGARHLSPHLGNRMLAARLLDRPVFVRELRPQDLKVEVHELTQGEAMGVARFLAGVVGHAHARQMDPPARRRWLAELQRGRSKTLDAPGWLWTTVVQLMAAHEAAYLDHCRRHALQDAA